MDQHKQIKKHEQKEKFKPDNNPKFENHTLFSGDLIWPFLISLVFLSKVGHLDGSSPWKVQSAPWDTISKRAINL